MVGMESESLLTCSQLASRLNVKPSTVRAWTSQRRIPFVRLANGRAVRYREADVRTMCRPVTALHASEDPGEGDRGER